MFCYADCDGLENELKTSQEGAHLFMRTIPTRIGRPGSRRLIGEGILPKMMAGKRIIPCCNYLGLCSFIPASRGNLECTFFPASRYTYMLAVGPHWI